MNNGFFQNSTALLEQPADIGLPEPLNSLVHQAVKENATDIHLDPAQGEVLIRFRVDGKIHEKHLMSADLGKRLLNQIKVASDLEPERSFGPQESQMKWRNGADKRDIRVGIIPAGRTEAFHLRLLTVSDQVVDINGLGLRETDHKKVSETLQNQRGLMLISGPTGAGKTISIYSLVSSLDLRSTIAISIEDPIEFDLPFLRQVQVNENRNLSMAEALRMFLRMDPDVIVIGEIRDQESAVTAARAALAGRLVLATIHAPDAAGAIEGLNYMTVPYYILGGSLKLIMTQGLVRRLCPECARPHPLTREEKALFTKTGVKTPRQIFSATGCGRCNNYGYRGRIGVYEVAEIDDITSNYIITGPNQKELRRHFRERGVRPTIADALEKVAQGLTSMEDVLELHWPKLNEETKPKRVRKTNAVPRKSR